MPNKPVQSGLDKLRQDGFSTLRGQRLGLLCHQASISADQTHALDMIRQASLDLRILFAPEHGIRGTAQDMQALPARGQHAGVPLVNLYGNDLASLHPSPEALADIDVLLIDLQDVGCRYYTFAVTMRYCLEACAKAGVRVVVTDRPNPINGLQLEGPMLQDSCRSFVGGYRVPVRHGLTIGELAKQAQLEGVQADLEIVPMQGWNRSMWFDQTGLPWVPPSPNMPTLNTAIVYPGSCLIESTNLSEGRGTDQPFETIGAPWLDSEKLVEELNSRNLEGVNFQPVTFTPTFQKHSGQSCHGVQLQLTDRATFRPFLCGLHLLDAARKLSGDDFAWREEPYEFVSDIPAVDMLTGTPTVRETLESGGDLRDLQAAWEDELEQNTETRKSVLLYN